MAETTNDHNWEQLLEEVFREHYKFLYQEARNVVKKKLPGSASGLFDTLRQLREHSDYHTWPAAGTTHEEAPPRCECQWNPSTDENCMYALGLASELLRQLAKQREF